MIFNFDELLPTQRYFTLTQTILPRPIAWVLSENEDESFNLAPFSYFSAVASDPALVMISVGQKDANTPKDTKVNIEQRNEFVIHVPHVDLAAEVTESSRTRPAGESEVAAQALETVAFDGFRLPRLKLAKVAFACERYKVEQITDSQTMIIGQVKRVFVSDELVSNSDAGRVQIDAQRFSPLGRLGGNDYAHLGETISIPRPA